MTQKLSDLDPAIDVVARRLTHVEDDQLFAAKIVAALPERTTWPGWWMPRLAGLVVLAGAAIVLAAVLTSVRLPFDVSSTNVATNAQSNMSSNERRTIAERPSDVRRTSVERPSDVHRTRVERLQRVDSVEPAADHEFSLPSLDVESLPFLGLPEAASIALAPLAIADLPLAGEFSDGVKE